MSIRLLPFIFLFYLLKTKLIINVHDPIQHTGEKNIKTILTKRLFHSNVYKFVTFSKYSNTIFLETNKYISLEEYGEILAQSDDKMRNHMDLVKKELTPSAQNLLYKIICIINSISF